MSFLAESSLISLAPKWGLGTHALLNHLTDGASMLWVQGRKQGKGSQELSWPPPTDRRGMQSPSIGEAEDSRSSQGQEGEKRGKMAFTQWRTQCHLLPRFQPGLWVAR